MNKYINANALAHKVVINGDADFINKITKLMIEVPSIDMVFCKDCKFWKKVSSCMSKRPNGYCDDGKRTNEM